MTEWVKCPICDEPDMRCEPVPDEPELKTIYCVNHACESNKPLPAGFVNRIHMDIDVKDSVYEKLSNFLKIRVTNETGDWTKVSDEDISSLHELFKVILDAKYDRDPDNHHTLELSITNRYTHERSSYVPVPYLNDDNFDLVMEMSIFNLKMATSAVDRLLTVQRYLKGVQERDGKS